MPPVRMTVALVSPFALTLTTPGSLVKESMTGAGFLEEASKSMSPMISLKRRRLPAVLQRMTSGCCAQHFEHRFGDAAGRRTTDGARRRCGGI